MADSQLDAQNKKKRIVLSILKFLNQELQQEKAVETQECFEVTIQCIESIYNVNYHEEKGTLKEYEDLMTLFRVAPSDVTVSTEAEAAAETYKTKGNELMHQEKYTEALQAYNKAISLNPSNAVYYCNRAAAFSRLGHDEQALLDALEAVKYDNTYSKAYARLGMAYTNLGVHEEAKKAYSRALELDPENGRYMANLNMVQLRIDTANTGATTSTSVTPRPFTLPPEAVASVSQLMNNRQMLSVVSQLLTDPNVQNTVAGLIGQDTAIPDMNAFLNIGHQIAEQMQTQNPTFGYNFRQRFTNGSGNDGDGKPKDQTEENNP